MPGKSSVLSFISIKKRAVKPVLKRQNSEITLDVSLLLFPLLTHFQSHSFVAY